MSTDQLKSAIAGFLKVEQEKLQDEAGLTELVNESFILVEMVMFLQDEFGVRLMQEDLKQVKTVGDLVSVFQTKMESK